MADKNSRAWISTRKDLDFLDDDISAQIERRHPTQRRKHLYPVVQSTTIMAAPNNVPMPTPSPKYRRHEAPIVPPSPSLLSCRFCRCSTCAAAAAAARTKQSTEKRSRNRRSPSLYYMSIYTPINREEKIEGGRGYVDVEAQRVAHRFV